MANFKELGVEESILKGIAELGFENATPVQEKVIPVLLEEQGDMVALAQTGTGKTAAFGLPVIQTTDIELREIQTVILSPTRELCLQISKDIKNYSKYVRGLNALAVYGGTDIRSQISSLRRGVHILVATPGRLLDLIKRGEADLSKVRTVVLDEADEMLNMGFKEDLNSILENTPDQKQTLLFSATMPREVESISKKYMNDAKTITVGKRNQGSDDVHHSYYMVKSKDCYEVLRRLVDSNPDLYGIVFCRTRQDTRDIARKLVRDGFDADALHGDLSQSQRDAVMVNFREKHLKLLIATDVAARGLDVENLTHVFNFNLPEDVESYTHRSGRTGRAGHKGEAVAIIHSREKGKLKRIENQLKKKFEYKEVPTGEEVCAKRLDYFVGKLKETEINQERIAPFFDKVMEQFQDMDKSELLMHVVSMEFNRLIDSYKNVSNINLSESERRSPSREGREGGREGGRERRDGRGGRERREPRQGFTTFSMNVGRDKGIIPGDIIGMINRATKTKGIDIGTIKILNDFSKFEIDSSYESTLADAFGSGVKFQGEVVEVKKSRADSNSGRRSGGDRKFVGNRRSSSDRRNSGTREKSNFRRDNRR